MGTTVFLIVVVVLLTLGLIATAIWAFRMANQLDTIDVVARDAERLRMETDFQNHLESERARIERRFTERYEKAVQKARQKADELNDDATARLAAASEALRRATDGRSNAEQTRAEAERFYAEALKAVRRERSETRADASRKAQEILAKANDDARQIIADAEQSAQSISDATRQDAQASARQIIENAQNEARAILDDANGTARVMEASAQATIQAAEEKQKEAEEILNAVAPFRPIVDAVETANRVVADAQVQGDEIRSAARLDAERTVRDAQSRRDAILGEAQKTLDHARNEAQGIVTAARNEAEAIIDDANGTAREMEASSMALIKTAEDKIEEADEKQRQLGAIKRQIDGYGNEYLIPHFSFLDQLADEYGVAEAGADLKRARQFARTMVSSGGAALCNYADEEQAKTARRFIIDAFNGKAESILAEVRRGANYGILEQKMKDAFSLVNLHGEAFEKSRVSRSYLNARLEELRAAIVAEELKRRLREEQREIKAREREEARVKKEIEKERKQAEREERLVQKALEEARKKYEEASDAQKAMFAEQIEELDQKLKEAEERGKRAVSMAQQTKKGCVYVISNVGSFGENVYKIGMTRRLDPQERVDELGGASVPFRFDVHALIETDDAPKLETALHRAFAIHRVNKVNPRKEFFRVSASDVRVVVENVAKSNGITEVGWTLAAEAREYYETQSLEKEFEANPAVLDAWLKRQNATEFFDEEETEEELDA